VLIVIVQNSEKMVSSIARYEIGRISEAAFGSIDNRGREQMRQEKALQPWIPMGNIPPELEKIGVPPKRFVGKVR
jgi:hypothetical protein